jgi:hypothetical protein
VYALRGGQCNMSQSVDGKGAAGRWRLRRRLRGGQAGLRRSAAAAGLKAGAAATAAEKAGGAAAAAAVKAGAAAAAAVKAGGAARPAPRPRRRGGNFGYFAANAGGTGASPSNTARRQK